MYLKKPLSLNSSTNSRYLSYNKHMETSKFLAKVIGVYLFIVSIAMLINKQGFLLAVDQLTHDNSAMFIAGFFTIILGILIVIAHNVWQWNWRALITLIGWIGLIKGIAILFYPQIINSSAQIYLHSNTFYYLAACIDLTLGLVLCYFGFLISTREEKGVLPF